MSKRVQFHMGRVHIPPTRDWSLWLTFYGFQLELNLALPPRIATEKLRKRYEETEQAGLQ